ncbi:40S ribosomal protein SA [Galemys pyrenaicus]|uniref:40S ribosomal protein SA n=1 Tax=Galemys pyrenaicus TaxID=202257 RepID=A0A8J6ANW9_GALPY|nr:40S ribosomal protein SA [Galemys pyrenaicus]
MHWSPPLAGRFTSGTFTSQIQWMLAQEVLRMHGTMSCEHPWGVMTDLCFYRDPETTEREEQALEEKAVAKEEF